jgi:hypothetical protein
MPLFSERTAEQLFLSRQALFRGGRHEQALDILRKAWVLQAIRV